MPGHKWWCFTAYSYPEVADAVASGDDTIGYYKFQEEQCPDTGRTHWQGYIEFNQKIGLRAVQRVIGGRPHLEPARDPVAAKDYCSKEDTRALAAVPVEWGVFRGKRQGERTDIHVAAESVLAAGSTHEIISSDPGLYAKYHRGLEAVTQRSIPPRRSTDDGPTCSVVIGPTGTGKTRGVYSHFGDSEVYSKDASKWWDGYHGQKCILFDDWVGSGEIPPVQLLKICDRYPLAVQTKGGFVQLSSRTTHIIFTSTIDWVDWYKTDVISWREQRLPFTRRVTVEGMVDLTEGVKEEKVDADVNV